LVRFETLRMEADLTLETGARRIDASKPHIGGAQVEMNLRKLRLKLGRNPENLGRFTPLPLAIEEQAARG